MLDLEDPQKLEMLLQASKQTKKKRRIVWILAALFIVFMATTGWLHLRVKRIERKQKQTGQSLKLLDYGSFSTFFLGMVPVPPSLAGVDFADEQGIVIAVKPVKIRNVTAPYNPSLVPSEGGYDLFFRYDVINTKLKYSRFSSHIGVVHIDHQFEQKEKEFAKIDLQTNYADDPRVVFVGDELFLFYNWLDENSAPCRFMCATHLDPKTYKMRYSTTLDLNFNRIEKNWSPFEYVAEDGKPRLLIEYRITPHKILELPDPKVNDLRNVPLLPQSAYLQLPWSKNWGVISGGTPPIRLGEEYFGFFHSWFKDEQKMVWYVMGAYTFDAKPPFNITRISKYPILFRGIYGTPPINTASLGKRVIFPSGAVAEKKEGRDLIHVSCGENDCSIKVVTFDKEKLVESMREL